MILLAKTEESFSWIHYALLLNTSFWRCLESNARGGAQPNINAKQIANMDIPLPTIHEQEKSLSALKVFEQLSVDMTEQYRKSNLLMQRLLRDILFLEVSDAS